MHGWFGKILRIDLSLRKWDVERPDSDTLQKFVGGRGLAGHYLRDHISRSWDDPELPLLFFAGPLVDTASPTSGRMTVMSRSPLTGTIGDASVGGSLGTAMKRAGWDGIIITGRHEELCGIEIVDDHISICPAKDLTVMPTDATHVLLRDKGATAVIGPAAENGVRFSNIMIDGCHAAGRNGLGLVCAAKNLKYLCIRGTGKTSVFDRKALKDACEDIYRLVSASPTLSGEFGISRFGTAALYDLINAQHMTPTANFRKTYFPDVSRVNAHAFQTRYQPSSTGCRGCHIRCKKISQKGESLPEFETISHFSALLENSDIQIVTEANRICNVLGMDTISAAGTLACYGEIVGKKLSGPQIFELLKDIGLYRGIGRELAQGSIRYAASCGRPECAVTVKGQELPAYDPRGAYGMALSYAVSTRGACHLRAYPVSHEILRKPVATDRLSFAGKARIIKIGEDLNAMADSLTACKFIFFAASMEEYARVFSAVTGNQTSGQQLLKLGERICYQERMLNAVNGFGRDDDDLPPRFFSQAGDGIGHLDRKDFLQARANYYRVRGLDAFGNPTAEQIQKLGLD